MKIKVVCFFYNESALIPFFLSHYRFADSIHAVVSKSIDNTEELLRADKRVTIEPFEFPSGIDDLIKRDKMNEFLMTAQDCDWIVAVDSDEFIFPSDYGFEMNQVKSFLSTVPGGHNVLIARMRSVFRNESDEDLDVNNVPVVFQRRHGEKNLMSAINRDYQKPSVIRSKCGISLTVGNHSLNPSPQNIISNRYFVGSHWQNADPSFCVTRRVRDRKERLSDVNMAHSYGNGQYHCTTESILKTCNDHGRDPICI